VNTHKQEAARQEDRIFPDSPPALIIVFRQTSEKCRFVLHEENTMAASEKDSVDCSGV
jgi:hypothetical protein